MKLFLHWLPSLGAALVVMVWGFVLRARWRRSGTEGHQ